MFCVLQGAVEMFVCASLAMRSTIVLSPTWGRGIGKAIDHALKLITR